MNVKTRYGMLNAAMHVYVDPSSKEGDDAVVVSYKGKTALDAGAFYCPYIPLQVASNRIERLARKRQKDSFPWRLRTWWERMSDRVERAIGRIWRSLVRKIRA